MTKSIEHLKASVDAPAPIKADTSLEPFTFGAFTFSATGISVSGKPPIEEWTAVGEMLAVQVRGIQFQVGDWLNIGEKLYGEMASQAIDARNWSEGTVRTYLWVSKNVPLENRRDDLTFAHHQIVAGLSPSDQKRWLKQAATDDPAKPWTVARLKAAIDDGGDLSTSAWFVLVEVPDETKQVEIVKELEQRGLPCKPVERRGGRRKGD